MTQRNPMNERYQGDGPTGKSKRSAASAKPARPAAGTVWERSKPATPADKRKAEKEARKDAEEKQRAAAAKAKAEGKELPKPEKGADYTSNPEYRRWRRWYWILLVAAIICTALSWFLVSNIDSAASYVPLAGAYIALGAALFIDFKKVRPFRTNTAENGALSSKQQKHADEAAAQARALEEARKASKGVKRGKNPFAARDKNTTQSEESAASDTQEEGNAK
jgi:hypothetical protein